MATLDYAYNIKHSFQYEFLDSSVVDFPLSRVKPLIKMLMAQGHLLDRILLDTSINIQDFIRLEKRISFQQYLRLVCNAKKLSSDPAFALNLGEQAFFNHDSLIGSRIISCPNVMDSMILLTRYQPLFTQLLAIDFELNQQGGVLNLTPHFPLGETLPFFMEYICAMIFAVGRYCLGGAQIEAVIEFAYPKPDYFEMYERFFSLNVRFNCSENRVFISKKTLHQPSIFYNKNVAKQVDQACVIKVNALKSEINLLDRVRNILKFQNLANVSLERLAENLCLSPRTLRRQLHSDNSSYKLLLEDARRTKAICLVDKMNLSMDTIAGQLGYADASSFSRAFKRWHGCSPKKYRELNAK